MIEGIYLMGILQGLILIGIVFYKSRFQSIDSVFISILISISTLLVLGQLLINTQQHLKWPILLLFITGLPLLTGPYLFFYLKSKLNKPINSFSFVSHHSGFILYIILLVTIIKISFSFDPILFIKQSVLSKSTVPNEGISLIGLIKGIHLLVYTVATSWLLKKFGNQRVKGLEVILFFFIASQIVVWILILIKNPFVDEVFVLLQVVFLYLIGYHSLLNNTTFIANRKYQSSSLDYEEIKIIFKKIEEIIIKDELFLDAEFSLKKLSEVTGFSEHQISQSINQTTGENFSTFINNYRVEKVKKLFLEENLSHLKIISIAFEAGFKNKNSFNQHFKRVEGLTPSEYKKKYPRQKS